LIVQAFINIGSGLIFRAVLRLFKIPPGVTFLSLLVYCLSYSMFNFWPWYNHLVFVFELFGFYWLCSELIKLPANRKLYRIALGAFFIALSFMTKQDTGALAFAISLALLAYDWFVEKDWRTLLKFTLAYALCMAVLVLPYMQYEFTYWFNMGQFPHNARVDKFDIINEFLGASDFIKLYLIFLVVFVIYRWKELQEFRSDKPYFLFGLLVLCILGQAAIIQVTSYTPIDGNIYFHSFAFAFIGWQFNRMVDFQRTVHLATFTILVTMWWSGVFWTRFLRERVEKLLVTDKASRENVISKRTYLLSGDTLSHSRSKWIVPSVKSFKRIRVPEGTAKGIEQLMNMPEMKKADLKMLNMSELTSLAFDMGYELERGPSYPLWFHKGVAFFDREVETFCKRVEQKEYDVVLFEDIPNVNQFYPYEVRDCIKENYRFRYRFLAPRVPEISYIEVYTKE
jgi:hypothetical protein